MRKGPDAGQEHSLIADTVTLGRDPLADVVINDPEVSRQHARLIRRGDDYFIQDLGSTNGTFLDGQRLAGELVPVAPGQVISVGGNVSLVFDVEGEDAPTVIAAGVDEEEEMELEIARRGVGIYDLPEDEPGWEADDYPRLDRTPVEERDTILDYPSPPHDLSYQEGPRELPQFGPAQEDPTPREPYLSPPPAQFRGSVPPPPPAAPPPRSNRNRNIILILLALLLLCCCCTLVTYFWLGDFVMEFLGLYS
jgi:pSer/pThr/pTyr-binding forkhead associated (FHA) protein